MRPPSRTAPVSTACRTWLAQALQAPTDADATVVITHFAPSIRSVDPRYGRQPTSASFCNADDDLLEWADLWIHGHLHARFDYPVARHPRRGPGREGRVVCQARGLERKGESVGHDPMTLVRI